MEAQFRYNVPAWQPTVTYDVVQDTGTLTVTQGQAAGPVSGTVRNEWDVRLGNQVPIELMVTSGSGDVNIAPEGVTLTGLVVTQGSGNVTLDLTGGYMPLPAVAVQCASGNVQVNLTGSYAALQTVNVSNTSGQTTLDLGGAFNMDVAVTVQGDSGVVTVRVPDGVGVTAQLATTSGTVRADGFTQSGSTYTRQAAEGAITFSIGVTLSSGDIALEADGAQPAAAN